MDHFMFDQVAGEYVQQTFGNKTNDGVLCYRLAILICQLFRYGQLVY